MSNTTLRAIADWNARRREASLPAPSLDLELSAVPPEGWAEVLGSTLGRGMLCLIVGVPLLAFTRGRFAEYGFFGIYCGLYLLGAGVVAYAVLRRGRPLRGWRQVIIGLAVCSVPLAYQWLCYPVLGWAGVRVPGWELDGEIALTIVMAPVLVRVYSVQASVFRLAPPAGTDPEALAWFDARLDYLESLLRSRITWPVSRREVARAIGHCRVRRFQVGRQVADLQAAVNCFQYAVNLTPRGSRDEPGAYHDLAAAMFQRAEFLAAGADYASARAWVERILALDVADMLPVGEREMLRRWLHRRTLVGTAWLLRLRDSEVPEITAGSTVTAAEAEAAASQALRELADLAHHSSLSASRATSLIDIAEYHLLFVVDLAGTNPVPGDTALRHASAAIEALREAESLCRQGSYAQLMLAAMLAFGLAARARLIANQRSGETDRIAEDHEAASGYALRALGDPRIFRRPAAERLPAGLAWVMWAVSFCLDIELEQGRWQEALGFAAPVWTGLTTLFDTAVFRQDREEALRIGRGVYAKLGYATAMGYAGNPTARRDVVSFIERGRAVLLLEALGRQGFAQQAGTLAAHGEGTLAAEVRDLMTRMAGLEDAELKEHDADMADVRSREVGGVPLADAIAKVREDYVRLRAQVAQALTDPSASDERVVFARSQTLVASRGGPLCYLVHMSRGRDNAGPSLPGLAVVVTPFRLDAEGQEDKSSQGTMGPGRAGRLASNVDIIPLPGLTADRVADWLARWDSSGQQGNLSRTPAIRGALLRELADDVMGPVFAAAGRPERLILLPDGQLSMLPLHAALISGQDGDRRPLCTQAVVTYAPSVAVMRECLLRAWRMAGRPDRDAAGRLPARFLGVADPTGGLGETLPEVRAASEYFPVAEVLQDDATPAVVRDRLTALVHRAQAAVAEEGRSPEARQEEASAGFVAHFACHACAEVTDPLSSFLQLGGTAEDRLTLADLLRTGLEGARLAVLSACVTGVPGTGDPDQYVSLATGFVQIGAAGVIATMCPVSDLVAGKLMERFYAEWAKRPRDPATALSLAQRALSGDGATPLLGDWVPFFFLGS
jgi:hypothetical protein